MDTSHDHIAKQSPLLKAVCGLDECLRQLATNGIPLHEVQTAVRKMYALHAMQLNHNRVGKAARQVGIHRNTLPRILNGKNKYDTRTERGISIQDIGATVGSSDRVGTVHSRAASRT